MTLYSLCGIDDLKGDAKHHAEIAKHVVDAEEGVTELPPSALSAGSVIVDGLLGTGLKGAPQGAYQRIIKQINESNLPVMALDVPSGLDADTGDGKEAVVADLTVTMGFPKQGMFWKDGPSVCGRVEVVGINLPQDLADGANAAAEAFGLEKARQLVTRRRADLMAASGILSWVGHLEIGRAQRRLRRCTDSERAGRRPRRRRARDAGRSGRLSGESAVGVVDLPSAGRRRRPLFQGFDGGRTLYLTI